MIDRTIFFNAVRESLFGKLEQTQVDGMNFKLDVWEDHPYSDDLRHLAYAFATSYHETGQRMVPVREGFCSTDEDARAYVKKQGYDYAEVDQTTGEVYYGRGDIQTTWASNYQRTTSELGLSGDNDLYWHPDQLLDPRISADALYQGMSEGWYRKSSDGKPQTLGRYFSGTKDDPYGAREIVNGDKAKVPSWSNGVSIGKLIEGYHDKFLDALEDAYSEQPAPEPAPEPIVQTVVYRVTITAPVGDVSIEVERVEA
jgi:hypothetical protein